MRCAWCFGGPLHHDRALVYRTDPAVVRLCGRHGGGPDSVQACFAAARCRRLLVRACREPAAELAAARGARDFSRALDLVGLDPELHAAVARLSVRRAVVCDRARGRHSGVLGTNDAAPDDRHRPHPVRAAVRGRIGFLAPQPYLLSRPPDPINICSAHMLHHAPGVANSSAWVIVESRDEPVASAREPRHHGSDRHLRDLGDLTVSERCCGRPSIRSAPMLGFGMFCAGSGSLDELSPTFAGRACHPRTAACRFAFPRDCRLSQIHSLNVHCGTRTQVVEMTLDPCFCALPPQPPEMPEELAIRVELARYS